MKHRSLDIEKYFNSIKVDKVILMDVLMLFMYSILATISATSMIAMKTGETRFMLFGKQAVFIFFSVVIIFLICNIGKDIRLIRRMSRWGLLLSLVMLVIVTFRIRIPFLIEPEQLQDVYRSIKFCRVVSIQVSEVVKVCMVAYLAWAAHALKNGEVPLIKKLAAKHPIFQKDYVQRFICLFFPMFVVFLFSLGTGSTNGLFILILMLASILIGGVQTRDMIVYAVVAIALGVGAYGIYKASDEKVFSGIFDRFETTGKGRIYRFATPIDVQIEEAKAKAKAENKTFDLGSIISANEDKKAQVAIKEGNLWGKGPGNSTMKYSFMNMFSDYVYAFLIEEYGILVAGIPLLLIFLSILSRGAIIARSCENLFARVIVSGYSVLLTGQGLLHMAVSVGLMPTTGQNLPLVSDGRSSLLMFSIAFGILLRISKEARKNIDRQEREMEREWMQEQAAAYPATMDIAQENSEIMEGLQEYEPEIDEEQYEYDEGLPDEEKRE